MSSNQTILIMGPPGAGKGTQAAHLVREHGLRHVATGDLLRDAVAAGTPLGREAKGHMESGNLVPDELLIGLLRELVEALPNSQGVLLDGFPRTIVQAEALEQMLSEVGRSVGLVLDIAVPNEVLVGRLSGRWICRTCQTPYNIQSNPPQVAGVCDVDGGELYQRDDDRTEAVAHRLTVYAKQTAPVSAFYKERGARCVIDGNRPMSEVQQSLDAAIAGARA